ncbi:hypothetical protein [Aeoliella sp.]|uniref:hypothetical protein n=1 Tax=Aeoliella sp. TaxID=2795800 RepID=UPI003CCBFC34
MALNALNKRPSAKVVTEAMRRELMEKGGLGHRKLVKAESEHDYPAAQEAGRVITSDTRLVVVDAQLKADLVEGKPIGFRRLLSGSVQLWAERIEELGLAQIEGRIELFKWSDGKEDYDADFDGIMAGILRLRAFLDASGGVI